MLCLELNPSKTITSIVKLVTLLLKLSCKIALYYFNKEVFVKLDCFRINLQGDEIF